jgi:hypothetical protein
MTNHLAYAVSPVNDIDREYQQLFYTQNYPEHMKQRMILVIN